MPTEEKEYWYRYEGITRAYGVDCDGDVMGPFYVDLVRYKYPVIKHTPKGVRLGLYGLDNKGRLVLNNSKKKYAHPTEEEALHHFIQRKKKYLTILNKKISDTNSLIAKAQRRINTEFVLSTMEPKS